MKDVKGREEAFKYIRSCCKEERNNLFSVAMANVIMGNELTLQKERNLGHSLGKTRLVRLAKDWVQMPCGVGHAPHLEVCKDRSTGRCQK